MDKLRNMPPSLVDSPVTFFLVRGGFKSSHSGGAVVVTRNRVVNHSLYFF